MGVAPRLGVSVYHHTDHVLRGAYHRLYRQLPLSDASENQKEE